MRRSNKEKIERLKERAAEMALLAVGEEMTVSTGPNSRVAGTITAAEFHEVAIGGNRAQALFKVWLEAGPRKTKWGPVIVKHIPS